MLTVRSCLPLSFAIIATLAVPVSEAQVGGMRGGPAINPNYAMGSWKVTAAGPSPDASVSALVKNDPSYMGAMMSVTTGTVSWDTSKTNQKGTYDTCTHPSFGPTRGAHGFYAITCDGKPWGFGASFRMVDQNTMLLKWYDGGVLTLTRQH